MKEVLLLPASTFNTRVRRLFSNPLPRRSRNPTPSDAVRRVPEVASFHADPQGRRECAKAAFLKETTKRNLDLGLVRNGIAYGAIAKPFLGYRIQIGVFIQEGFTSSSPTSFMDCTRSPMP